MLPRSASAHQRPADPPVIAIGVGIDTSRYGHYAAFLDPDLQTSAPDLEVIESAAEYAKLRQRLLDLVARHGRVHFHVRLDAAGLYADNLLAWFDALEIAGATFTVSCGDTQRNKNYRVAVYGHQKSDPVEARACARQEGKGEGKGFGSLYKRLPTPFPSAGRPPRGRDRPRRPDRRVHD